MWLSPVGKAAAGLVLALTLAGCSVPSSAEPGQPGGASAKIVDAPAAAETATVLPAVSLPDMGPAAEIENEVWLNTDRPLRLADMRGKVVLIEFWTFG